MTIRGEPACPDAVTTGCRPRDGADRARSPAVDRRHRILERVAEEQTIHVGELARELGVSEMTIRRDIRRLERDGFLRQTYGGATAHLTRSLDVAFNARALQHTREKRLIGMRATRLLGDARVVFVGIGTTAEQFARYLPARPGPDRRHRLAADRQPARDAPGPGRRAGRRRSAATS